MEQEVTKEAQKGKNSLKFFYTNADQFVNKRDDLLARIADDEPDVILITEVIPKSQSNPIAPALLKLDGYKPSFNFQPSTNDLGERDWCFTIKFLPRNATSGVRGLFGVLDILFIFF